jgi:hypothetical protein
MSYHDQVETPRGLSEACKYNDHPLCVVPRCFCDCHNKKAAAVERVREAAEVHVESTSPAPPLFVGKMVCPKCSSVRPEGERFCRSDGVRLLSLLCPTCGTLFSAGDKYCHGCGSAINADPTMQLDGTPKLFAQSGPRPIRVRPAQPEPAPPTVDKLPHSILVGSARSVE